MHTSVSTQRYLGRLILTGILYALTVYLSLFLVPAGGSGASLVWPPSALALVIIFFWGYEMWPAFVFSFFVLLMFRGSIPPVSVGVAAANTLEALLGVYLLKRSEFDPMLARLRDTLSLILVAFTSSLISSSLIALTVFSFSSTASTLNTTLWAGLWIGHTVSILTFAPFLFRWLIRPRFTKTSYEIIEGVTVFGTLFTLDFLIFWTPYGSVGNISLVYILIVPLIWASLRTGPRGISLTLMATGLIGATGVLFGYGPLSAAPDLSQILFSIQVLIGTLSLIFLLFTSITEERKNAVINLQDYVGRLETALGRIRAEDQAKTDFVAILAHELRNPLSPILSGLEILKTHNAGEPQVLAMMGAHMHTIARLLDDLLDITRINQKKFKLQKEPVQLQSVVDRSIEMVRPYLDLRKHSLHVSMPPEDVWINGDPVRLAQLLVNLLNNSAKYTDPNGTISLTAQKLGDTVEIRVRDTGMGIAQERISHIFEAFGGTEGTSRRPGGLRIGLSLAKRMAEMHHGTIEAKSQGEGRGSEFIVTLPIMSQAPLDLPTTPATRSRFSKEALESVRKNTGRKILVVDDNESAAQTLGSLLTDNGHEVTLAYNGTETLSRVQEIAPQIVILDIGLPDIDGYEVGKRLREKYGTYLSLVALTGYGQEEDKQKALDVGFDYHLVKPVSIVDVERILTELGK
jgi:signal transduction histidine kinase/CheY-like chemotaxis protein